MALLIKIQILMTHPEFTNKANRNQDERQKSADLAFQAPFSSMEHGNIPKNEAIFKMKKNLESTQEPYCLMIVVQLAVWLMIRLDEMVVVLNQD